MAIAMRIRAGNGDIRILMTHPSENGLRKDAKSGQLVPAHFVKNMTVVVNGKTVLYGQLGGGISKDPYHAFKVRGMKTGDKVTVTAEDNTGDKGSIETSAS
ncbi:MAG: thiosulfate oxidation carrier complex protein SoxZ [Thiobacillus sp.]|nr:thiosulfate oxidation carrier complex protein SoxZ [Thiobacillus sp.]